MKLVSATIYPMHLPFVESFTRSTTDCAFSDSIVVKVCDESGAVGFGEGAPRFDVTGETQGSAMRHLAETLWPSVAQRPLELCPEAPGIVPEFVPDATLDGAISDGASRCALELAILDLALRLKNASLAHLLAPRATTVIYSGAIGAGSIANTARLARQMKLIGMRQVKIKVGRADDLERVRIVREIMGPNVSIRLDANGAWSFDSALSMIRRLRAFGVACVEQPIARGAASELAMLRRYVQIPIMADESMVTIADARRLIVTNAVDYFNIRVSKCGGIARASKIAWLAQKAGVRVEVGSQAGETAILSAAGRHLAASMRKVDFIEGSYGTMLLAEDVTADPIRFGHRGEAPVLTGAGHGVRVIEDRIRKYAAEVVRLN
jgi:L-alanine-DL-glutamate epimerase-like enolase superfamily enzyme